MRVFFSRGPCSHMCFQSAAITQPGASQSGAPASPLQLSGYVMGHTVGPMPASVGPGLINGRVRLSPSYPRARRRSRLQSARRGEATGSVSLPENSSLNSYDFIVTCVGNGLFTTLECAIPRPLSSVSRSSTKYFQKPGEKKTVVV